MSGEIRRRERMVFPLRKARNCLSSTMSSATRAPMEGRIAQPILDCNVWIEFFSIDQGVRSGFVLVRKVSKAINSGKQTFIL